MSELIDAVNRLRGVRRSPLAPLVRTVVVILGNSRSGSSLLKEVLAGHPDIASLDGEIEPLLALTGNGFGYNADSDALDALANPAAVADNIFDELGVPQPHAAPAAALQRRWVNRCLLQFPALFAEPAGHRRLTAAIGRALADAAADGVGDEQRLQRSVLAEVYRDAPWRLNYYDDGGAGGGGPCFDEAAKIEEPPFVVPRHQQRPFTAHDAQNKIVLFKAPSDVYRIGIYQQLFPHARVHYLHLSRGYAQSVNGLMDGWLSPVGFFSHDLRRVGQRLAIGGYSELTPFGRRWWKFDLPPNWREFTEATLEQVCLNQWLSAHRAVLASGVAALRISFEQFLASPGAQLNRITDHLGARPMAPPPALRVMMATDAPRPMRWKKRQQLMLELGERRDVRAMMATLGYAMKPEGWR
ncbi:hypothetical protein ACFDR9_000825 [Janthinobacterium sp. CG_23.3]|uniref:sulfotransferase n=1 Tax=unclassified Janthinobacterium TaxID=2610881 RepID=UPI0003460AD6|nr:MULTISPECIES: sulfotransferase [unclassified Janthinobacterium]MEC5159293.1 hypothetical protein [Janthinobacterium sp. CG_S6]